MKKIIITIFILLISSSVWSNDMIKQLSMAKQTPFHPAALKSVKLSNGMTCYLLEDHSVPLIRGRVLIRGGSVNEDIKQAGIGSVMVGLLKDGGTIKRSPSEVRDMLDQNAVDISFSIMSEVMDGYFGSLANKTDTTLSMFFEMLFEPRFDKEALEIVKKQIIDSIKREQDVPDPVSKKKFRELVYGANSPWGRIVKTGVVGKITTDDVNAFYNKFFSPDRMILAVSGDFKKQELLAKLEEFAKKYPSKKLPEVSVPPADVVDLEKTETISKNFSQSAFDMGHLGSIRNNPDKYPLIILNEVFGGGSSFTNRLMSAVRVKEGLVYSIFSAYNFGPDNAPGLFQIHAKTKTKTTSKAIQIVKDELLKISNGDVTAEEFKKAKDSILNAHVFEYESPFEYVSAVARFVYFGYPENYIEIYKNKIEKTTLDDVNNAAKKYIHPDKLKLVVVGKKK